MDRVKEKNEKIEKKIVQARKIPSTVKGTGHKISPLTKSSEQRIIARRGIITFLKHAFSGNSIKL